MMTNKAPLAQATLQKGETPAPATITEALPTLPPGEALPRANSSTGRTPRWKQAVVTIIPAYIGSTLFGLALFAFLPNWPFVAINVFMNLFLVLLLTYVAQPLTQRWLSGWLSAPPTRLPLPRLPGCRLIQKLIAWMDPQKGGSPCRR